MFNPIMLNQLSLIQSLSLIGFSIYGFYALWEFDIGLRIADTRIFLDNCSKWILNEIGWEVKTKNVRWHLRKRR